MILHNKYIRYAIAVFVGLVFAFTVFAHALAQTGPGGPSGPSGPVSQSFWIPLSNTIIKLIEPFTQIGDSSNRYDIFADTLDANILSLGSYATGPISAPYFTATSTTNASTFPRYTATNGTTTNATSTNLAITGLSSSLLQVNANGGVGSYAGTSCTNQFVRALSALGIATCASVDLAADVTGVLPIANGGTNASSQTTNGVNFFNGTSITSGSALTFNGNTLGISVNGSANAVDITQAGSGTSLNINNSGSGDFIVVNTDDLVVKSSGRVGIGLTDPTTALHVRGATDSNFEFGSPSSSLGRLEVLNDARSSYVEFRVAASPITFYANGIENVRVHTNGNLGVGTSTPNSRLSVAHTSTYLSANAALSLISATDPKSSLYAGYDDTINAGFIQSIESGVAFRPLILNANGGNIGLGTTTPQSAVSSAGDVLIWDGVSDPTIFADVSQGYVGIGTRTPAEVNNQLVIVSPDTNFATVSYRNQVTGTAAGQGTDFYVGSENFNIYNWDEDGGALIYVSNGDLAFNAPANGDVQLAGGILHVDAADSFVGVGTTNPARALSINNDVPFMEFRDANQASSHLITSVVEFVSSSATRAAFFGINSQQFQINTDDRATDIPITFRTVDTERVRIGTNGRVGIGTTTAQSTLDIEGAARSAQRTLTDGATITVDVTTGNKFRVTLGGNRAIDFTNVSSNRAGQSITLELCQDGTGSRTVTWDADTIFVTGSPLTTTFTAPTLSTTANVCNVLGGHITNGTSTTRVMLGY